MAVKRCGGNVEDGATPVSKKPRAESEAATLGIKFLPQYTKFMSTPNQLLRFYLAKLEPQIMSTHALKALNTRGARDCPRDVLAQIAEFLTGVGVDEILPPHVRETLDSTIEYLQARNIARHRRAFCIKLPPNWEVDGLFRIVGFKGSEVAVVFNLHDQFSVSVDIGLSASFSELAITNNWSEKGATLVSRLKIEEDWNLNQEFAERGYDVSKMGGFNAQSRQSYARNVQGKGSPRAIAGSQLGALQIADGSQFGTPEGKGAKVRLGIEDSPVAPSVNTRDGSAGSTAAVPVLVGSSALPAHAAPSGDAEVLSPPPAAQQVADKKGRKVQKKGLLRLALKGDLRRLAHTTKTAKSVAASSGLGQQDPTSPEVSCLVEASEGVVKGGAADEEDADVCADYEPPAPPGAGDKQEAAAAEVVNMLEEELFQP